MRGNAIMERMDVPSRYRKMYNRTMVGHRPLAAMKTYCMMCVGWELEEMRLCTAPNCPLYPYTHRVKKAKTRKQKAVADPEATLAF
jgi:hypothetical protein